MTQAPARRDDQAVDLRLVVTALFAAALVSACGWGVWLLGQPPLAAWQLALLLVILPTTELSLLHLRYGTHQLTFTWGEVCVLISLALVSPGWLVVMSLPLMLLVHLVLGRDLLKAVCNASIFSLGASFAGLLLVHLADPPYRIADADSVLPLLLAVTVWSVFSVLVTGLVIARAQGQRPLAVLASSYRMFTLIWAGNVAIGGSMLFMAERSAAALFGLPPVLLGMYLAYRGYVAARQERDVWQQLEAATRELNALDEEQVARAALSRTVHLFRPDGAELLVGGHDARPLRLYRFDEGGTLLRREAQMTASGTTSYVEVGSDGAVAPLVTCLSTPLEGPKGRVGALRLLFSGPVKLRSRERQVLSTFAHAVATTLLNAALYDDMRAEAARQAFEASHDHLTSLGNRSLLSDRTAAAVAGGCGTTALLLLDLDHFKEINDTLGHAAGDVLLQEVGRRLQTFSDGRHLVARLGGDEFAVLLTDLPSPEDAEPVAAEVLGLLAAPVEFEGLRLSVEASLGVACHPQDADTAEELFRRADVAMYQAKAARGQWLRYSADRDDSSVHRQALVAELRAALDLDQIVVHFQPQVDLESGLLVGAEALSRWQHPARGLLLPGEFVSVVEHSGLVRPFTLRVLDQAVAQCALWQDQGRPISVAVNLSARSLLDRQLPRDVAAVLARHGLAPDRLVLEITETTVTSELEVVEEVLAQLREMGVEISVDDFGTGYSSLAFLQRTAVHELKVDRTFVAGMLQSENDRALVRATVQLARSLGARSVAEGVEDDAQAAALHDMGCDVAQGFWLSRPIPAAGMRSLLGLRVTAEPSGHVPLPRSETRLRVLRPAVAESA